MKGVKSRVLSFLLNEAILETQTISNGRLFQISIILFAKLYRDTFSLHGCLPTVQITFKIDKAQPGRSVRVMHWSSPSAVVRRNGLKTTHI